MGEDTEEKAGFQQPLYMHVGRPVESSSPMAEGMESLFLHSSDIDGLCPDSWMGLENTGRTVDM